MERNYKTALEKKIFFPLTVFCERRNINNIHVSIIYNQIKQWYFCSVIRNWYGSINSDFRVVLQILYIGKCVYYKKKKTLIYEKSILIQKNITTRIL